MRTAGTATAIAGALTAGLLLAGCAHSTDAGSSTQTATGGTNPSVSVPAWYAAGGATLTTRLGADLAQIGIDATGSNTAAMGAHCDALATDTGAATNYPPIPDVQAQQHWKKALDALAATSRDCTLAAGGDPGKLGAADDELRTASAEMAKVNARVNALGAV